LRSLDVKHCRETIQDRERVDALKMTAKVLDIGESESQEEDYYF